MSTFQNPRLARVLTIVFGAGLFLSPAPSAVAQSVPPIPARASLRHTTPRQIIRERLDKIVIPVVAFDDLPLPEVIKFIQGEIAKSDSNGKRVNFMLNSYLVESSPAPAPVVTPDPSLTPAVPSPTTAPASEPIDLDTVLIKVAPPLHDLTVAQVLDAVMKSANSPIRFTIEDYAVVFFRSTPEAVGLASRGVRVNPNTFQQGLQSVTAVTVLAPNGGQGNGNSSGGVTIGGVIAAPGGGSGGISGVTTPGR